MSIRKTRKLYDMRVTIAWTEVEWANAVSNQTFDCIQLRVIFVSNIRRDGSTAQRQIPLQIKFSNIDCGAWFFYWHAASKVLLSSLYRFEFRIDLLRLLDTRQR